MGRPHPGPPSGGRLTGRRAGLVGAVAIVDDETITESSDEDEVIRVGTELVTVSIRRVNVYDRADESLGQPEIPDSSWSGARGSS